MDEDLPEIDPKNDLCVKEVCGMLPYSPAYVYHLIESGDLWSYRLGKVRGIRIPRSVVNRFMDRWRLGSES
jgi:excisionase family DNA binding protein